MAAAASSSRLMFAFVRQRFIWFPLYRQATGGWELELYWPDTAPTSDGYTTACTTTVATESSRLSTSV
ncbi:hypothetical protein GCM10010320_21140 [Streptomyces caelestis]|nr:hypothetical protein GCM10010320_21140 [Streptomyces caelestis]